MPRTLILRGDHLGDAILTTPLIRALAKAGHQVDFAIPDAYLPLFAENPYIYATYGLHAIAPTFPSQWWQLARWIRRQKYDVLILPRFKPRTLLYATFFSGVRRCLAFVPLRWQPWGRVVGQEWLTYDSFTDSRHYSATLLDAAQTFGISGDGLQPEIFLRTGEIAAAQAQLKKRWGEGTVVGIHAGHNANACQPSPQIYERICDLILKNTDWRIVITGIASEQGLLKTWSNTLLDSGRVWNAMGLFSLRQSAAMIKNFQGYICSATGTLHVAAALGTPTVTAFCPVNNLTSENVWGSQNGKGAGIEPSPDLCSQARKDPRYFCDFSGKIRADQFVQKLAQIMAANKNDAP